MSGRRVALVATTCSTLAGALLATPPSLAAPPSLARPAARLRGGFAQPAAARTGAGRFVLTAHDRTAAGYAPTFTGNGYLGVRVPPAGQGYAGGAVPAQSELAGFYAQPPKDVQQRANLPTWSSLVPVVNGHAFDPAAVTGWRQSLDLHTGIVTTRGRWRADGSHVSAVTFQVLADRARAHVAAVRLTITPQWSGRVAVRDLIDGTPATLTTAIARHWDARHAQAWESVRANGTGVVAALASRLQASARPTRVSRLVPADAQSVGQRIGFAVRKGQAYTVTKFVGVTSSHESAHPAAAARAAADGAARRGFAALLRENRSAWAALWRGRIDVLGNPTLATEVNASEFYLWSSTRSDVPWSISPAGLSSNGYDGHIFWDAETWMHPALLAQHPTLARAMDAYRYDRLAAARAHARQTGYRGARFPWESALDGTEQIPPPVSVNSEGLYEVHITADIALAQWQYFTATGDRRWLRTRGWPVISQAARFWASRVTRSADGRYHLLHVTGPDEENPDVNDEAYTNTAAAKTLLIAAAAGRLLGHSVPASWSRIARGLVLLTGSVHPEFASYQGQLVKQADVTMLQYPWARPMPKDLAQRDLEYYVPRSDPGGPSMSDAINAIDTAALGTGGCASYVYTQRSIQPFMRDVFDQFSETSTGGAFTFMTGIGGFLQEFLYGYSGLRMFAGGVHLDPSLTGALGGVVLHDLAWHGRRFTVAVRASSTTVTLQSGAPLPVTVRGVRHTVREGHAVTVRTRRPDRRPTTDVVRCAPVRATSARRGAIALAAVDGSPATTWQPASVPASLTVHLTSTRTVGHATVVWGRTWPPAPGPNIPPPPAPVTTHRASDYSLYVSTDGTHWRRVARVTDISSRTTDQLSFPASAARYVQLRIAGGKDPMLGELTVTR